MVDSSGRRPSTTALAEPRARCSGALHDRKLLPVRRRRSSGFLRRIKRYHSFMLHANRSKLAWLLLPLLVACHVVSGCEDSCDEEARCSQAKFNYCSYDGCGQLECFAVYVEGNVICNEDGTEGCSAWPEIDEDCASLFNAPRDQAGCSGFLLAVMGESSGSNTSACREAVLNAAPCALEGDVAGCDFAPIDAACFDDPPQCQ